MAKYNEIKVGMKIGLWTILEKSEPIVDKNGRKNSAWICECGCEKHTIRAVREKTLKNGKTSSCGCTRNINKKKYNTYDLSGEYGIGYTSKDEKFYFDLEDYEKIKDYCWRIDKHGYVVTTKHNHNPSVFGMHNIVMNCFSRENVVDHIYHKTNDNRKNNLRIVTNQQNGMNKKLPINNTSGYIGVTKNKNKWIAQIKINGKNTRLGSYLTKNEAIQARKEAEIKYFGEYRNKDNEVNAYEQRYV